jgi:hypothetical protein
MAATIIKDNQKTALKTEDFAVNLAAYNWNPMLGGCTKNLDENFTKEDLFSCWENKLNEIKINFEKNIYPKYTVKKGDNLFKISKKYNLDLKKIREVNQKGVGFLKIGEEIQLPFENLDHLFKDLRFMRRIKEAYLYITRTEAIENIIKEDELL